MTSYNWTDSFKAIYDKALDLYQRGNRDVDTYFTPDEIASLASMGCKPIEVYDFVEDHADLDWEKVLLITSVRRAHYLFIEGSPTFDFPISVDQLPAKDAEIEGIPWLPRLIAKANAKLRGQLPRDIMYCCGGDRAFLRKYDIHPADFLRLAWYAAGDQRKIVDYVKCRASQV